MCSCASRAAPSTSDAASDSTILPCCSREEAAVYSLPETAASSLEQHGRIVEALAASDVEGAARLAQEHMLDVARRYSAAPRGPEGSL